MWQSTKKFVRQLIKQNNKDFVMLNEKYEEILKAKKEADIKTENLVNLVSLLMQNQTAFIANVSPIINSINEIVGKIDDRVVILSEKISDGYKNEEVLIDNLGIVNLAVQQLITNTAQLDEANRLLIAKTLLKDMEC